MIRRARLSFKPNVKPGGRGPGSGAAVGGVTERDGAVAVPPSQPEQGDSGKNNGAEVCDVPAVEGNTAPGAQKRDSQQAPEEEKETGLHENTASNRNEVQQNRPSSTPLQRRKRISTLPNLAKPRVSNSSAVTTPSQKASQAEIPESVPSNKEPLKSEISPPERPKIQTFPKSPKPHGVSQGQNMCLPEKKTPVPQVPQFSSKKSSLMHSDVSPAKVLEPSQKEDLCPLKERPSQESCVNEEPPNIIKPTPVKRRVGNLERERIRRAQKLRDLLRDELKKERKAWKEKHPTPDISPDLERSKMTMRDFIHFIPVNNPMTSSLEENKSNEKSLSAEAPTSGPVEKNLSNEEEDDLDEEADDGQLLVPRVKVAEDGSIILDEESLTVEVSRTKAVVVENGDPIFERGSTTTYSSFRKNNYSKPWSNQETDMFFLAISMVGTDFSMIGQLFPHRERIEIKNKFKREERANGWRIDKAFREKKAFDFEFFASLLERALAKENKEKKSKSKNTQEKKTPKPRKKQKGKSITEQNSQDAPDALSEGETADARTAEKENEESQSVTDRALEPVSGKKRRGWKRRASDTQEPESEIQSEHQDDLSTLSRKHKRKNKIPSEEEVESQRIVVLSGMETVESEESFRAEVQKEAPDCTQEKKKKGRKKKADTKEVGLEGVSKSGTDLPLKEKSVLSVMETKESDECFRTEMQKEAPDCTQEKKNKGRKKKAENKEPETESPTESCSDRPLKKKSSRKKSCEEDSVVIVDHDVSEATDDGSCVVSEEPICGDGSMELFSMDEDEDTFVSDANDCAVPQTSSVPLFDQSRTSVDDVAVMSSPKESSMETSDCKFPITAVEKTPKYAAENPEESGAKMVETTTREECKRSPIKPMPLTRGRFQRPKPNVGKPSTRKGKQVGEDVQADHNEANTEGTRSIPQDHKEDLSLSEKARSTLSWLETMMRWIEESHEADAYLLDEGLIRVLHEEQIMEDSSADAVCTLDSVPVTCCSLNESSGHESESALPSAVEPDSLPEDDRQRTTRSTVMTGDTTSLEECRLSPIKPTPLTRGRFQRPKPNVGKPSTRIGKQEWRDDVQGEQLKAATEITSNHSQDHQEDLSHSEKDPCPELLESALPSAVEPDSLPEDFGQERTMRSTVMTEQTTSQEERGRSTVKPTPLTRGRFQRPKPNVGKPSTRIVKQEARDDVQGEQLKAAKESTSNISQDHQEDSSHSEKREDKGVEVSSLGGTYKQDSLSSLNDPSADPALPLSVAPDITPESNSLVEHLCSSSDIRKPDPVKPAVLSRGRLVRPKPNVGRAAVKRDTLSLTEETKDEKSKDEKEKSVKQPPGSQLPSTSNVIKSEGASAASPRKIDRDSTASPGKPGMVSNSTVQKSEEIVKNEVWPSNLLDEDRDNSDQSTVRPPKDLGNANEERKPESLKPGVLQRGRFLRPKPNLNRSATRSVLSVSQESSDDRKSNREEPETIHESMSICNDQLKSDILTKSPEQLSISGAENVTGPSPLSSKDLHPRSLDHNEHLSHPKQETQLNSEAVTTQGLNTPSSLKFGRARFQKPKPNLGNTAGRKDTTTTTKREDAAITIDDVVVTQEEDTVITIEDDVVTQEEDAAIIIEDVVATQEEDAAIINQCLEEDKKSSPARQTPTVRGHLQRPKPNLMRAVARRAASVLNTEGTVKVCDDSQSSSITEAESNDAFIIEQISAEQHKGVPLPPKLSGQEEGHREISSAADSTFPEVTASALKKCTAIKPATLRRGRPVRPKPNLMKASRRGEREDEPAVEDKAGSSSESERTPTQPSAMRDSDVHATDVSGTSPVHKRKAAYDSSNEMSPKRTRVSETAQRTACLSDSELDHVSLTTEEQKNRTAQRSRFGRQLRKVLSSTPPVQAKSPTNHSDCSDKNGQSIKPSSSQSKVSKLVSRKGKTALVKLRASRWEEEEEEDGELDYEEEHYNLSPDKVNQAPVFVPFSLRSPNPVPAEIEETVEELEIPVEVLDVHSIPDQGPEDPTKQEGSAEGVSQNEPGSQAVPDDEESSDGSTEAAMALISMGNRAFQSGVHGATHHGFQEDLASNSGSQRGLEQGDSDINPICTELQSGGTPERWEPKTEIKVSPGYKSGLDPNLHCSVSLQRICFPQPSCESALDTSGNETRSLSAGLEDLECPISEQYKRVTFDVMQEERVTAQSDQKWVQESQYKMDLEYEDGFQAGRLESDFHHAPIIHPKSEGEIGDAQPGIIVLECIPSHVPDPGFTEQSSGIVEVNCTDQFEQTKNHTEDLQPPCIVSHVEGISDENNCPAEETTFILTLVEIPISSEYPYSCDSSPVESLPAPVLINPNCAQPMIPDQSHRTESLETSAPVPDEHCSGSEVNPAWTLPQVSRKRSASDGDQTPPRKKPLLECFIKEEEHEDLAIVVLETSITSENDAKETSETHELDEEAPESTQCSVQRENMAYGEEMSDCTTESKSLNESTPTPEKEDLISEPEALSSTSPLSCTSSASLHKTALRGHKQKSLGFLALVCKDKRVDGTKSPKHKKKKLPKPNYKKVSTAASKSQQDVLVSSQEDVKPPQVPSPSENSSCADNVVSKHEETDVPVSDVPDEKDPALKESTSTNEVVSEEEATTISEYFFSDIFMPVDED
ncbi:transcription factor TFIIIB component B'' homolog [Rhinophrynus dorsalis]